MIIRIAKYLQAIFVECIEYFLKGFKREQRSNMMDIFLGDL